MIFRLWKYILGYVVIKIEGFFSEKFINISSKRQIKLWHIYRDDNGKLFAKISVKDFLKIRPVAFKSRCRIKIIKRVGLPFVIKKYRKRKALPLASFYAR